MLSWGVPQTPRVYFAPMPKKQYQKKRRQAGIQSLPLVRCKLQYSNKLIKGVGQKNGTPDRCKIHCSHKLIKGVGQKKKETPKSSKKMETPTGGQQKPQILHIDHNPRRSKIGRPAPWSWWIGVDWWLSPWLCLEITCLHVKTNTFCRENTRAPHMGGLFCLLFSYRT